jgi:hypothetical protein
MTVEPGFARLQPCARRLCLTTMASLARVLTPQNRAEVLPRFLFRQGSLPGPQL